MHLLIDADIVVFRFSSAFERDEKPTDWGGGIITKPGSLFPRACKQLDRFVKYLQSKTWATKTTMCFTDKKNFRYSVLPTYKYNRVSGKPKMYNKLKTYVLQNYTCKSRPGLEADDVMGIMSTLNPGACCIATIDKDLLQIPGKHYNWNWNRHFECFLEDCNNYFYQQILTGDPGDGYKGIPGVGVARAIKILQELDKGGHSYWLGIVQEYEERGLTEADALQQARVARMCRAEDYDYDKGEVILWEP